jgi:hypothetical protein
MNRDPITINGKEWIFDARTRTHRPAEAVGRNNDRTAIPAAATQRAKRDAPTKACQGYAISERVDISVYSYRVRSCDTEGPSVKAALDGIVDCGVIKDDSAKEVRSVRFWAAEKAENISSQKTIIKIRVAE